MIQPNESDFNLGEKPGTNLKNPSADLLSQFEMIADVFQQIEDETAEIAEMIFDYLVSVADEHVMTGTIPAHPNPRVARYIQILNRLFAFSRKGSDKSGIRIINRKTIENLDKKTFAICMCQDGGTSLDILCDIVNVENQERTPKSSPVKVTVMRMSGAKSHQLG
jgi:hypothetical protein